MARLFGLRGGRRGLAFQKTCVKTWSRGCGLCSALSRIRTFHPGILLQKGLFFNPVDFLLDFTARLSYCLIYYIEKL
jgi:hypothetical protein